MSILLITNGYPKDDNLYNNAFIHRRTINYLRESPAMNLTVFVLSISATKINYYEFDSINVIEGNQNHLDHLIKEQSIKKILIHFLNIPMMKIIQDINYSIPVIIWVHGVEALGWYRRLFNFDLKKFPKYIIRNTQQMLSFHKFIKESNEKDVTFIFVSKWMKDILEQDSISNIKRYEVIPNVIDNRVFQYRPKPIELRKSILLIRPFSTKKYANDIAIDAILLLSQKNFFHDLRFTIFGEGKYFDELTGKVKHLSNVEINNTFLSQKEMAQIHMKNGVFLCPTRQDAQGVSMCEAMSSGLVPITSNNTAIPEFVTNNESGILTENAKGIAEAIEGLYNKDYDFSELSLNASLTINNKCNPSKVLARELQLICE